MNAWAATRDEQRRTVIRHEQALGHLAGLKAKFIVV
jgi:hypothetical protein